MSCAEVAPLLELLPLEDPPPGALEPDERARVRAHLDDCAACRARVDAQARPWAVWTELTEDDMRPLSPALRERVLERFAAERAGVGEGPKPAPASAPVDPEAVESVRRRVALSCSFCRDRCAREDVVYCAECLAPHHLECFRTHGRCCLPGCETTRFVRPQEADGGEPPPALVPPRPRPGLLRRMAISLSAAAVLGGVAALTIPSRKQVHSAAPVPTLVEEPRSRVRLEAQDEPLGAVVDRLAADAGITILVEPLLRERRLTLSIEGEWRMLLNFLAMTTGTGVDEAPANLFVLRVPRPVRLTAESLPLGEALQELARQAEATVLVDPRLRDVVVPADVGGRDWREVLPGLAQAAGGHLAWVGEVALVTADPLLAGQLERLRAVDAPGATDSLLVSWSIQARPLRVALQQLRAELRGVGANLELDPSVGDGPPISATFRQVPWLEALRGLCRLGGCRLEGRPDGGLLVVPRGSSRVRLVGCPARAGFDLLARLADRGMQVPPGLGEARLDAGLRDVSPELALRLVAQVHGLELDEVGTTWVVRDDRHALARRPLGPPDPHTIQDLQVTATAVRTGRRGLAVLEGQVVSPGGAVYGRAGGPVEGLKVEAITDGAVSLRQETGQLVVLPLTR